MLNYNYNIIIPASSKVKKGADFRNNWYWSLTEQEQVYSQNFDAIATGSFTLATSASNAIGITTPSNGYFLAPSFQSATASLTASGVWPTTGSYTMSLSVYGQTRPPLPPIVFYTQSLASAADNNIAALSGSKISLQFLSNQQVIYSVSASIIHKKGNIFNPPINWENITIGKKPSGSGQFTFNAVKNANELVVSASNTANNESGSFDNLYSFNVTSSLTGSVIYEDWYHAQTTMSLAIPEIGISRQLYFTGSVSGTLTASFTASTDTPYTITSSVQSKYIDPLYLETYVIGGGGGGAAGGVVPGGGAVACIGGGGGAGGWYQRQFWIQPNTYQTASAGTAGSGGITLSGSYSGTNGTTSSLVYYNTSTSSLTVNSPGGLGGNGITGKGGASGNGFSGGDGYVYYPGGGASPTPSGGGGGGTQQIGGNAPALAGGDGGLFLGGGGGGNGLGANSPSESIVSGKAGDGGTTVNASPNPPVNTAGRAASAYGGGGGGGWGNNYGSSNGGNGGSGVVVLKYQATSSLLTFTKQLPSNATKIVDGYVYHYITGSNVGFAYIAQVS